MDAKPSNELPGPSSDEPAGDPGQDESAAAPSGSPPDPATPPSRHRPDLATPVVFLGLTVAAAAAFAFIKLRSLYLWQYTSDMFMYDQIMALTLDGHFGLEYTYGNQFGDHAYLIILALLPVKLLIGRHMVALLTALGPLSYGLCAVLVYLAMRRTTGPRRALLPGALCLAVPYGGRGIFEITYGCHFDTFSGFLAVGFAALLVWRRQRVADGGPTRGLTVAFAAVYLFFFLLKEEMALLGVVFFAVLLAWRRDRFALVCFAVSLAGFLADYAFMSLCKTPFNRTNSELVRFLFERIERDGFFGVLFNSKTVEYWTVIAIFTLIYGVLFALGRRRAPEALALFVAGLAKLAFSFLPEDADMTSWHNFPGVAMLTGAVALQLGEGLRDDGFRPRWIGWALGGGLVAAAVALFAARELPFLLEVRRSHAHIEKRVTPEMLAQRRERLREIKARIDRDKIVAINGRTVVDWVDGFRFTFFPRGVYFQPLGVADYIVFDRLLTDPMLVAYLRAVKNAEFERVAASQLFILFKRHSVHEEAAEDRRRFVEYFGPEAIGETEPPPVATKGTYKGLPSP